MNKRHALVIALIVGLAALAGLVAATQTVGLGRASDRPSVSPAAITAQNRALDRTEANLRRILGQRPVAGSTATAEKVVYKRPAPHVVTIHRSHTGEDEAEGAEREGGFDG